MRFYESKYHFIRQLRAAKKMSIIGDISGIGAAATALDDIVGRFIADPNEKAKNQLALELAQLSQSNATQLAQIAVNQASAAQGSRARDAFLWIGAAGLGLNYLIAPFFNWYAAAHGIPLFPVVDLADLNTFSLGLLGITTSAAVGHAAVGAWSNK